MVKGLSKSLLLSFLQCRKRLYLEIQRRDLIEEVSPELQRIFDTGHAVGELAQQFYPEGIFVENYQERHKSITDTQSYLDDPEINTLFEATFTHQNVFIRADLLHKTSEGFHIQEVKSAASVKEFNIEDCAIQTWVIEGAGYTVNQIDLTHINSQFVYKEEGNYEGIFTHVPLTDMVREIQSAIGRWVEEAFETIESDEEPDIHPGEQCTSPYICPFIDYCDPQMTEYPVECLPNGTRTAIKLRNEGIEDIRDIPIDWLSSERQERVRRVTISGQYELDEAARLEILDLNYPRYYIDFETINPTIPIWLNTSPFQQIPFQWSCHIENDEGDIIHKEYLDTSGDDPRRAFIEALIDTLSEKGSILVYNATFEKLRLKESAELFHEHREAIDNILRRIVDLLPIARNHYYHPDMRGSWSLKMLLPTIAPELDYSELEEVHHGMEAQDAYLEAISPKTKQERKEQLKQHLLKYCEMDTIAMVKIAHFFEQGGS